MEVDALIVGGGPVGLVLACGLLKKGLKVTVVEKSSTVSENWSTAYNYRIDCRGIALFGEVGLLPALESVAVPSQGFSRTDCHHDGTFKEATSPTAISLGYWIQRPILMKLLEGALPSGTLVEGTVQHLEFGRRAVAKVQVGSTTTSVNSWLVFGCDGSRSKVREHLQAQNGGFERDFTPHVLNTPSTGLVYKAVLYKPPDHFDNTKIYVFKGKSGRSVGLLPFAGKPGDPRPVSFAQAPEHQLHSFKTPEELYSSLDEDFPQMEARERLPPGSAAAWCTGEGTTFPHARWCSRASAWIADCGVTLLGDSLHCFPPDLGQGVNAGLSDVSNLLALWPQDACSPKLVQKALEAYNEQQAPEAEAICRLIPIGMPYQYNLPNSFAKFAFFGNLLTRILANKLMPWFITPPVVFQVTTAPPLRYTHILKCHRENTRRLFFVAAVALSSIMGSLVLRRRRT